MRNYLEFMRNLHLIYAGFRHNFFVKCAQKVGNAGLICPFPGTYWGVLGKHPVENGGI